MRTQTVRSFSALFLTSVFAFAQGDLTPPGAPVPTMKTLDQVEPRVVVNSLPGDASAAHIITESGSYKLDGRVSAGSGQHGIDVRLAPGDGGIVTIDLCGFAISGVAGSLNGINAAATPGEPVGGINVSLEQLTGGSIVDMGDDGIHCENVASVNVDGITLSDNGGDGIEVNNTGLAAIRPTLTVNVTRVEFIKGAAGFSGDTIGSCVLSDCQFASMTGNGISVDEADAVTLGNISVASAGATALHVKNVSSFGIETEGIKITAPTGDGLLVEDCDQVQLGNVNIVDAGANGARIIRVSSFGVTEEGIKITAPTGDGLLVEDCDQVQLGNVNIVDAGANGARIIRVSSLGVEEEGIGITAPTGDGLLVEDCNQVSLVNVSVNGGTNGLVCSKSTPTEYLVINMENVFITSVGSTGVVLEGVDSSTVKDVFIANAGGDGLVWDSTGQLDVSSSRIVDNGGDGISVTNCESFSISETDLSSNASYGVQLKTCNGTNLGEVKIHFCGTAGGGGTIASGGGILADGVGSITLEDSILDGNQNDLLLITGGSPSVSIRRSSIKDHPGRGIAIDSGQGSVLDCDLTANAGFAIDAGAGFSGAIRGNHCTGNGGAILVSGTGCSVTENSGDAGSLGFLSVVAPGNVLGPTVDETSVGTATNPHGNILR